MFRKLTKYEWKAYAKSMFFLLIAVTAITIIAIASIAVFDASQFDSNSWFAFVNMTTYIGIFLLYYFGIIAGSLLAIILLHFSLKRKERLRREREDDIAKNENKNDKNQ